MRYLFDPSAKWRGGAKSTFRAPMVAAAAGTVLGLGAGGVNAQGPCPTGCPANQQVQICIDAGRIDSFAAPDDPVTPRPDFFSFFCAGNCKGFDNAAVNQRFLQTFRGLPCGIVSASLEVKLRAECDIPANDSINLQFNLGPNTFSWGRFIRDLSGAGGAWECPATGTFTLNLAALPTGSGTIDIIPQMNADHFLDLYIQDDTTVDYARLTLRICPCEGGYRTYTNGFADNFAASPIDPPSYRQPRLDAIRNNPPFLWREPDECAQDRGYGQTFGPLPAGISRATLTMRIKGCPLPDAGGSGNDSLALEMLNAGVAVIPYSNANFYRAFQVSSLTGGTWPANQPTQVSLNLGTTLVGGNLACGSLLGPLSDRYFDVYLQDDTSVDWATLRVWSCPPLTRYFGTAMHANGRAVLEEGPTGALLVSNIGSSGNDGVAIDVHGADGYEVDLDPAVTHEMTVGRFLIASVSGGEDSDGTVRAIASIRASKHFPDGLWIDAPVSDPGACTRVVLSNSLTGESAQTCLPAGGSVMTLGDGVENMRWWRDGGGAIHQAMRLCCPMKCCDPTLVASDGTALYGDTIEFVHDGGPPIEQMSMNWGDENGGTFGARASVESAKIVLDRETGRSKGLRLGQASLDTNPGAVAVSNIGSSGQDGVAIDLGRAGACTVVVDEPCAGTIEDCLGSLNLIMSVTGVIGGEPDQACGQATLHRRSDGFFDIFADFSDIGAASATVEVFEGDTVTGSATVAGPIEITALTTTPLTVWGVGLVDTGGTPQLAYVLKKEEGGRHTPFHNRGAPIGSGDGVRIIAEGASLSPESIQSIAFRAGGISELLVRGLTVTPPERGPTCFADFNQDGGIDGADVDAFFASWEAGSPDADANQDGGTDGADVEIFFAQWSAGGCG